LDNSGKQAENITMSGGGLYSLATKGAKDVIDIATPRVIQAIRDTGVNASRFALADMGCADAGTSLDMIRNVLGEIRSLDPEAQVTVVYADQPANDFNALVSIVHGRTRFESWLGQFPGAYPLVSGSSFYLQSVPDGFLDFIFSATAMHWLSALPCNISNHVHMVGATGSEYADFASQAKQDWQDILLCRSRELKPGGRMVLVNFCRDPKGRYLGNTGGVSMFDTLNEIWVEFVETGEISEAEYRSMTLPQYYHTVDEFKAPLVTPENPVYLSGLRLESIETQVVPCPFAEQFKRDGDLKTFAQGLIPTVRSWNQSIFRAGLDGGRSETEKDRIIESYYHHYHQRVVDDPWGHGMDYVHAYMTISRV
jgi:hypothetical protein